MIIKTIYQINQTNLKKMKKIYSTLNIIGIEPLVKQLIRKIKNRLITNILIYQKFSKRLKIMNMMFK